MFILVPLSREGRWPAFNPAGPFGFGFWLAQPPVGGPRKPASCPDALGVNFPASWPRKALVDAFPGDRSGVSRHASVHLGGSSIVDRAAYLVISPNPPDCLVRLTGGEVRLEPLVRPFALPDATSPRDVCVEN